MEYVSAYSAGGYVVVGGLRRRLEAECDILNYKRSIAVHQKLTFFHYTNHSHPPLQIYLDN